MSLDPNSPNTVPDLTAEEFRELLSREVQSLGDDVLGIYRSSAVTPVRMCHTWEFEGRHVSAPVWVVARRGPLVVGYDEVEEEYGVGLTESLALDGVVDDWGTFGERLRWTLLRFPALAASTSRPAI